MRYAYRRGTIWADMRNAAFQYDPNVQYGLTRLLLIGEHCSALKYEGERPGMCCSGGKVRIPDLPAPPEELRALLDGSSPHSTDFLKHIRYYNNAFQMTSFGCDKRVMEPGYMPTFKIQGQVYHTIGSLLPPFNEDNLEAQPVFLQVFFMGDSNSEVNVRHRNNPLTKPIIVRMLQNMLHQYNPYVRLFKAAVERMPTSEYKLVIRADKAPQGQHPGTFNAPTINEVAIIMMGDNYDRRDIVLHQRDNVIQRINEFHRSYDALQYPLVFWNGQDGYHFNIPQIINGAPSQYKTVSCMDFYASMIMIRSNDVGITNWLLAFGDLTHQVLVDVYAKVESERLTYIATHQAQLRATEYINLLDAVRSDRRPENVGRQVILPSSFIGSPRHMHEYAQDCMTYVRKYGRPDLFITFTCNPDWPEIKCMSYPSQGNVVRHDVIARVFQLKVTKLMDLLTKGCLFGESQCWCYTIEWQKRGLPHSHILLWLKEKIRPNQINSIISAEIPEKEIDPILFETVTKHMIHGPCGAGYPNPGCMHQGKCKKRYPRQLIADTQTDGDGYPLYRRRKPGEGGFSCVKKVKVFTVENGQQVRRLVDVTIDNRFVVPYSPFLCKAFDAHINVESCSSISAIKYICKYVYKGSDQSIFAITNDETMADEILQYRHGRYISSNEAVWRILGFPIHKRDPTVQHLCVHLENGQRVYFTTENAAQRAEGPPRTTLTAFFELCQIDEFAKALLYVDIPTYYTWTAAKTWQSRRRGTRIPGHSTFATNALGRVYTVHPNFEECYYLRMLLHVVRGPTSFEALRTVNDILCRSYKEACLRLGLLENDQHWSDCLREAVISNSPIKLRELFAIILTCCHPSNPRELWERYKQHMSEDVLHLARQQANDNSLQLTSQMENQALIFLEDKVLKITGLSLSNFDLQSPERHGHQQVSHELIREMSYDLNNLRQFIAVNEPKLDNVPEQKRIYETLLQNIRNNTGGIYFLDAPGGTGKTFLINLILAKVRSAGEIALATASSGIAATLLNGGRTAHSTFKLPLDLTREEAAVCNVNADSATGDVFRRCKFIVWDECTMAHKHALEAVNKTLQDCRKDRRPMGGVLLLLAGDFRQTLPIVPRGTVADELNACLKASYLWRFVQRLTLKTNMRALSSGDSTAREFSQMLLRLGSGQINDANGNVSFPANFCNVVQSLADLKNKVFSDIVQIYSQGRDVYNTWLCERAILAPRNDAVNEINTQILREIPGQMFTYTSVDTTINSEDSVEYPVEFLNSLEPSGLPPHRLELKMGAPIILLRNLDAPRLCNGTRLSVKTCMPHVIEATIMTGCSQGEDVFLPRIPFIQDDKNSPLHFKRLQFPVRVSYAMTINKAQGQSLKTVGVNLEKPCFSHGQLYVACSRVGSGKNLYILAQDRKTENIVLQNLVPSEN